QRPGSVLTISYSSRWWRPSAAGWSAAGLPPHPAANAGDAEGAPDDEARDRLRHVPERPGGDGAVRQDGAEAVLGERHHRVQRGPRGDLADDVGHEVQR